MSKIIKLVIVVYIMGTTAFYGQRQTNSERIQTLKIAFITEKLDLSSSEAQVFWPIYNEYQKNLEELRKKERKQIQGKDWDFSSDTISDKDLKEYIAVELQFKDEKHNLEMSFLKEVVKKLSPKKTLRLIKVEENFKRRLLQQFRNRRNRAE